ncbi:MAG: ATP-binding protein [Deltaproteobacteria bacterium]|nr:ATP-binding protein [Deltaproteobacteria bacterium]
MKQKLSNHKTETLHGNTSEVTEIHDQKETEHLSTGFYSIGSEPLWDGSSLPYHELGGPGLERLCYLVLLEQGEVPRYFGKPGQEQYGIDLLVSHGGEYTVYQCKNVKSFPPSEMKKALELFEKEWLGRPGLPRPTQFVLCCSLPLREREQNEKWTTLERQFHERTGVSVVPWDCNYLDGRLRRLPDVVADLFSDRVAERFCNMDDWNKDLFRPVMAGSGEKTIDRYLDLKATDRIYLDPKLAEDFTQKLEDNESLLIRGLPGTGKTTTGLALAESFHQGQYRIFYVNLRYNFSEDALVTGIKRRLARPTIFLLDDCHLSNFR